MTMNLCCQQLDRVAEKLKGKQDRIYYLHDTARSHVAKLACEKLLKLGWITVCHLPYSSDLATTIHLLIGVLSNHLHVKKFDCENDLKIQLINFFGQKFENFYDCGILSPPGHWQQPIGSDDAYITES